jgi:hypothetical protein
VNFQCLVLGFSMRADLETERQTKTKNEKQKNKIIETEAQSRLLFDAFKTKGSDA